MAGSRFEHLHQVQAVFYPKCEGSKHGCQAHVGSAKVGRLPPKILSSPPSTLCS